MFYKIVGVFKGILKNFTNFIGKYLCWVSCEGKRLATKNELTSNIYNLWYLGAPKALGRFPRTLSL